MFTRSPFVLFLPPFPIHFTPPSSSQSSTTRVYEAIFYALLHPSIFQESFCNNDTPHQGSIVSGNRMLMCLGFCGVEKLVLKVGGEGKHKEKHFYDMPKVYAVIVSIEIVGSKSLSETAFYSLQLPPPLP